MHINLETKKLDFHQPMAAMFDLAIAGPRGQFRIASTSENKLHGIQKHCRKFHAFIIKCTTGLVKRPTK